ncbi:MAG: DUF4416 family protein [Acidobacteriota bacterium]|jgi:hypothetical protein
MGAVTSPAPVKLFMGVLTSLADILPAVEQKLSSVYGAIDSRSGQFPFEWTRYYNETMGYPIYRYFLGFEKLIEPPSIADIKIGTNEMESQFAAEWTQVSRPVNLDPGYIEESKLVLASTKNFYHRILIAQNIYAEVTLHYERGAWRTLPWTFPDYASENYHSYFMSLRKLYRKQLNSSEF